MPPKEGSAGSAAARRGSTVNIQAISAASKDTPFRVWLGQILAKRQVVEVLRSWDKGGDGKVSREEFHQNIKSYGFQGNEAGAESPLPDAATLPRR